MAISEAPEIKVTFRHTDSEPAVTAYVLKRLSKDIYLVPNLMSASVEVTFEHTRPVEQRCVVQITLMAGGTMLRVEDRGPSANAAIDTARNVMERRIRDWKERVYYQRRQDAADLKEEQLMEATQLPPKDKSDLIVRRKSHETKPMFPEDAAEQMELLGHGFYFFLNAETGQHNVIYRRKAGGYGLIVPAIGKLEPPEVSGTVGEREMSRGRAAENRRDKSL